MEKLPVCDKCLWFFPHWDDHDYDCLCGRDVKSMLKNKMLFEKLDGATDESAVKEVLAEVVQCADYEVAHFMLVQGFPYTPKQVFILRDVERQAKRLAGEEEVD